jgi:hypothetical protein
MSSNPIPESLSSEDLTSSQLEYDSDAEDEKRNNPLPYMLAEFNHISTSLEKINNTHQKHGDSLMQRLDKLIEQNDDLLKVENTRLRLKRESDGLNRKFTWIECTYLVVFGTGVFAAVYEICDFIFRK